MHKTISEPLRRSKISLNLGIKDQKYEPWKINNTNMIVYGKNPKAFSDTMVKDFKIEQIIPLNRKDNDSDLTLVTRLSDENSHEEKLKLKLPKLKPVCRQVSKRNLNSYLNSSKVFSSKTLIFNWFEERHLEEEQKKIRSNLNKLKFEFIPKIESTQTNLVYLSSKYENFTIYLSILDRFEDFVSFQPLEERLIAKLTNRKALCSLFRIYLVNEDSTIRPVDSKPLKYNQKIAILSQDNFYSLSSRDDFVCKENSSGLQSVCFSLINSKKLDDFSKWTIQPFESKHDSGLLLERYAQPIGKSDRVLIKHLKSDKYLTIVKNRLVCHRLFNRLVQNNSWSIQNE